jgi:hypothetical protein
MVWTLRKLLYFLVYPEQSALDLRVITFRDWMLKEAAELHENE